MLLTSHQIRMLIALLRFEEAGDAPRLRELAAALDLSSTNTVRYHAWQLQPKGLLRYESRSVCPVRLTDEGRRRARVEITKDHNFETVPGTKQLGLFGVTT